MTPRRVPLFWIAAAFATGCLLGFDRITIWPVALALAAAAMAAWFFCRGARISLALCYLATIFAGLAHTLLLASAIAPDDARRLPADKELASTQWRGQIIDDPRIAPHRARALDRTSFTVQLRAWRPTDGQIFSETIDEPWRSAEGRVSCTVLGPAQDVVAGNEVEFAAGLKPIPAPVMPGQLDLRAFDGALDIYEQAAIQPLDWRCTSQTGPWLQRLSFAARDWAYERLRWGLEDDPRIANFLAGMLIGYRQEIPTDIEQDFRVTGTLHVFAISGQNVAEVVVVAILLLQLAGLVRWRWAWVLAPIMLVYCLLAGAPASAIRATVMALAILLAWRLGRPLNALGCWSIAALGMMVWGPRVLLDPGAQLSFGVVLGLILISPPIYRGLVRYFHHDPFLPERLLTPGQAREEKFWSIVMGLIATSIAATLVSEPITALDFHQVTPISVVANLLVVPLAGLITVVGTISVTVSLVSHALAAQVNNANWLLAKIMIALVSFFAHEPGAAINVPDGRVAWQPRPFLVVAPFPDGACVLVRGGDRTWLIDTGRASPPPTSAARLLQFYGVNRLDALVLAQPDTPDNGAAAAVAQQFRPQRVAQPALASRSPFEHELPQVAEAAGVPAEKWSQGASFNLGPNLRVEVIGPALASPARGENDRALVLLFQDEGQALLDASRLDVAGQAALLRDHPDLRADVLVLSGDAPPNAALVQALGVRFWLRTPPRLRALNLSTASDPSVLPCSVWPLDRTGAVTVHFTRDGVGLTPWVALP